MANVTITAVRPLILNGARVAVNGTASVEVSIARDLVWRGDATATFTDDVTQAKNPVDAKVSTSEISDAGAMGKNVVKADNLTATLTALGATLGANDSGGTGKRAITVANA